MQTSHSLGVTLCAWFWLRVLVGIGVSAVQLCHNALAEDLPYAGHLFPLVFPGEDHLTHRPVEVSGHGAGPVIAHPREFLGHTDGKGRFDECGTVGPVKCEV